MKTLLAVIVMALAFALASSSAHAHFYAGCKKNPCKRHVVRPFNAYLNGVAWCESRRHWHLDGVYDGGLQFSPRTWNATGSRYAFAYQAPELEQKYRAVVWASMIGWAWHSTAGWPVCG